jgi:hypothetical protein
VAAGLGLAGGDASPSGASGPDTSMALSCPSVSFCAVVGGTSVATYAHGVWSRRQDITRGYVGDSLNDVSCPTATFCVAVGGGGDGGEAGGSTYTYVHGTWSRGPRFYLDGYGESAVSCASTTWCVADGWGALRVFQNGTWSQRPGGDGPASAISCPSAALCLGLIGNRGDDISAFTLLRGTVSSATPIGFNPAVLTCASTAFCLALAPGVTATYANGTWTSADRGDTDIDLWSVSCPSASFCLAVGSAAATSAPSATAATSATAAPPAPSVPGPPGYALTYTDGTWLAPLPFSRALTSVSCATVTHCAAVDTGGDLRIDSNGSWHEVGPGRRG